MVAPSTIADQEEFAICGAFPDIDPADPDAVARISLSTRDTFLEKISRAVSEARTKAQALLLAVGTDATVYIDSQRGQVASGLSDEQLRILCGTSFRDDQTRQRVCNPGTLDKVIARDGINCEECDAFLWNLALWTYRGRIPAGTDLDQRVYLRYWPNLTRLMKVPNAMRVAALWSEKSLTLPFTAEALGVPQRHVFAFYSAAFRLGLAGPAKRQSDSLIALDSVRATRERGYLSRVMGRLLSKGET